MALREQWNPAATRARRLLAAHRLVLAVEHTEAQQLAAGRGHAIDAFWPDRRTSRYTRSLPALSCRAIASARARGRAGGWRPRRSALPRSELDFVVRSSGRPPSALDIGGRARQRGLGAGGGGGPGGSQRGGQAFLGRLRGQGRVDRGRADRDRCAAGRQRASQGQDRQWPGSHTGTPESRNRAPVAAGSSTSVMRCRSAIARASARPSPLPECGRAALLCGERRISARVRFGHPGLVLDATPARSR